MGILDSGLELLGIKPNSVGKTDDTKQGIVGDKQEEPDLEMSNEDIYKLFKKRQLKWESSNVKVEMEQKGKENERYYLGEQYAPTTLDVTRPMVDNAIFEAMETHIPQATKKNPEPMVSLAIGTPETDETKTITKTFTLKLAEIADELKLRLVLKDAARFNELYLLSVAKIGWDLDKNIPTCTILRPEKMILDPDAHIDHTGYTGEYIGEFRKMEAGMLLDTLKEIGGDEDGIAEIEDLIDKKERGTEIQFIEWWERGMLFWTMGKFVLLKQTNINWNEEGFNHFASPKMPYVFLSVFNLKKSPVDVTSNTTQNLSNQDRLNKRNRQIDKGMDRNILGGTVVSLANAGMTQEHVKPVSRALENGGVVAIPSGDPNAAIVKLQGQGIPAEVFTDRDDIRARIKDVGGTRGSSAGGLLEDDTVRGKYLNAQKDGDRVGGGVSEYLEQFADEIYNWFVQMLFVHDETIAGKQYPKLKISVKEGSLLPKDAASEAAQAVELATAGLMSKLDLFKALDKSNPEEMAANAWLEVNAPEVLYASDPRVAQVMAAKAAQTEPPKPPSISVKYEDLTPDAKAQALAQNGITAHPEGIAAWEQQKAVNELEVAKATAEHGAALEGKKAEKDHEMAKETTEHGAKVEVEKAMAMPKEDKKPAAK